ncbi:pentatricopeptide repeat-containing protein At2g22070 [Brachypodium distachyon]|uniref:pentatricopeptide repeat-containing protein At2g22070 n=1 Tax=Brachypodium distachyon TaxID=15368 RepID=UPI000234EC88|nr:pentatricopeptide repeat-containing protein At2g22070 [Brachypodium distachyon]|eukprot:XP_024312943.1 pentatricopeptide repeat-containing protein At2g22070 [Brachypodium distachyon]
MRYAARKAAAALQSPPTLSSTSSAPLLQRSQSLCASAPEKGLARISQEIVSLPISCVRGHHFHNARKLLDETPKRSASAWTAFIAGCARSGRHMDGLSAFTEMRAKGGAEPNAFVLAAVLRCCAGLRDMESGKCIHGWMLRNGAHLDVVLCNAVLDMYAKCGDYECTKRAFKAMTKIDAVSWNIVISACMQNGDILGSMQLFDVSPLRDTSSWNTVISGLMRNGCAAKALDCLYRMARARVVFNHYTYSTALALAGMLSLQDLGRQLHGRVLTAAVDTDAFVRSSLMDMYCKCGSMETAVLIFDSWSQLTGDMNFAWSAMVAGYVQNGREEEAFEFFRSMLREGVAAHQFTLTSAIAACANAGMVEQGRIFDRACAKNVALWTSMLCSYASHGKGRMAIELFNRMTAEKITPNEITLVGVLSACSHGRLVNEGDHFFKLMQDEYGIVPSIEHYNCMVDLYGRAGMLYKAHNFIKENNIKHEAIVWKTLLSACRLHKHMEYAKLASENLIQLEECDAGSYVMLSNVYATHSKWLDTSKLRSSMRERRVWKQPGRSWIHLKNIMHTFVAGDTAHPRSAEIYAYLEKLMERLKDLGYTSRTDLVAHDVEEEQRETALKFHSEKLAIAFGIISTPSGTPLRIFKNLRVCVDCHEAIKYVSQATDREIVVRDLYRFHHFKDAKCSCEDFW